MAFNVGDAVEAQYGGLSDYYKGQIVRVNKDGTFFINYDDGDAEDNVSPSKIKSRGGGRMVEPKAASNSSKHDAVTNESFLTGDAIRCLDPGSDTWANAIIMRENSNGTYKVKLDSGTILRFVKPNMIQRASLDDIKSLSNTSSLTKKLKFDQGHEVEARSHVNGPWKNGAIFKAHPNGAYDIVLDTGDFWSQIDAENVRESSVSIHRTSNNDHNLQNEAKYVKGDVVEALYEQGEKWYRGKVTRVQPDGTYCILYDDGDVENNVQLENIRRVGALSYTIKSSVGSSQRLLSSTKNKEHYNIDGHSSKHTSSQLNVNDKIEARFEGGSAWYTGQIKKLHADGTYDINYDDGDQEYHVERTLIRPFLPSPKVSPKIATFLTAPAPQLLDNDAPHVLKKGDRVEARFEGGDAWYVGSINKAHSDGTYSIRYDDGDKESHVHPTLIRLLAPASVASSFKQYKHTKTQASSNFELGQRVEALFNRGDEWYLGKIVKIHRKGTYDIHYDDGDKEKKVPPHLIRAIPCPPPGPYPKQTHNTTQSDADIKTFRKGDQIEARFEGGDAWYPGCIMKAHKDGTYNVEYDDGDKESRIDPVFIRLKQHRDKSIHHHEQNEIHATAENADSPPFCKGNRIEARFDGGSMWYKGTISKTHKDGTYSIRYDDGDREKHVNKRLIRHLSQKSSPLPKGDDGSNIDAGTDNQSPLMHHFQVGQMVQARYKQLDAWHAGVIHKLNADDTFEIHYNDGDQEYSVQRDFIRAIHEEPKFSGNGSAQHANEIRQEKQRSPQEQYEGEMPDKSHTLTNVNESVVNATLHVGDIIEALFGGGAVWYQGIITGVEGNGEYTIDYDDGDHEEHVDRTSIRLVERGKKSNLCGETNTNEKQNQINSSESAVHIQSNKNTATSMHFQEGLRDKKDKISDSYTNNNDGDNISGSNSIGDEIPVAQSQPESIKDFGKHKDNIQSHLTSPDDNHNQTPQSAIKSPNVREKSKARDESDSDGSYHNNSDEQAPRDQSCANNETETDSQQLHYSRQQQRVRNLSKNQSCLSPQSKSSNKNYSQQSCTAGEFEESGHVTRHDTGLVRQINNESHNTHHNNNNYHENSTSKQDSTSLLNSSHLAQQLVTKMEVLQRVIEQNEQTYGDKHEQLSSSFLSGSPVDSSIEASILQKLSVDIQSSLANKISTIVAEKLSNQLPSPQKVSTSTQVIPTTGTETSADNTSMFAQLKQTLKLFKSEIIDEIQEKLHIDKNVAELKSLMKRQQHGMKADVFFGEQIDGEMKGVKTASFTSSFRKPTKLVHHSALHSNTLLAGPATPKFVGDNELRNDLAAKNFTRKLELLKSLRAQDNDYMDHDEKFVSLKFESTKRGTEIKHKQQHETVGSPRVLRSMNRTKAWQRQRQIEVAASHHQCKQFRKRKSLRAKYFQYVRVEVLRKMSRMTAKRCLSDYQNISQLLQNLLEPVIFADLAVSEVTLAQLRVVYREFRRVGFLQLLRDTEAKLLKNKIKHIELHQETLKQQLTDAASSYNLSALESIIAACEKCHVDFEDELEDAVVLAANLKSEIQTTKNINGNSIMTASTASGITKYFYKNEKDNHEVSRSQSDIVHALKGNDISRGQKNSSFNDGIDLLHFDYVAAAELRHVVVPQPSVHEVVRAALALLGHRAKYTKEWKQCRKLLTRHGRHGLQHQIASLDMSKLNIRQIKTAQCLAYGTYKSLAANSTRSFVDDAWKPLSSPRRLKRRSTARNSTKLRHTQQSNGHDMDTLVMRHDLRLHEVKQVSRPAAALLQWVFEVINWFQKLQQAQKNIVQ